MVACLLAVVIRSGAGGEHFACHPGHEGAGEEPVALGEEAGAQAGDDDHRVVVEAAQGGLDDVDWVGHAPVDDAGGGALAFSEALWAETRGTGVRILALCPGPVATGYFTALGDQDATTSVIYRRMADPADVVKAALRGFDRDTMTVIPGLRTSFLAQGYRFFPRTAMARMTGKMLAPSPAAHHS